MKANQEGYLSPKDLEGQENLSLLRLQEMSVKLGTIAEPRPTANFIDLMNWVRDQFQFSLKNTSGLNKFVHNRVIIDGQFLSFCEERNIKVECLYKDSIISWKTDNDFEKFFAQGVFRISTKNVEFLHAALFHKGNQNEDEISFFIICSESNYEGYRKLRNEFDEWSKERDRSDLHIHVVGGESIPYTKDSSWDDLFLPKEIKLELKSLVENFLSSKEFYLQNRIPWKRGVLLYGPPGNGKTSIIRTVMSCYNFKPITIVSDANVEAVREAFAYAEEQSPALLYFEDLDSLFERGVDVSSFLNLMDGISARNGLLVIATANDVRKLKANITDRPSRFDRKFEIDVPNAEMAHIYLRRWFGKFLASKKCKELAKRASQYDFSYAYLKELYISSMFEALGHNRKSPTVRDVQTAFNRLLKDKRLLNGGTINMDKYFSEGHG
jgi:hypothetical protein